MSNLRKDFRVNCSIPALIINPSGEPRESWGVIYDISLGGLKIETPGVFKKGASLLLSFIIGNQYHFKKIKGDVIRVLLKGHSYIVGIQFASAEDKKNMLHAMNLIESVRK